MTQSEYRKAMRMVRNMQEIATESMVEIYWNYFERGVKSKYYGHGAVPEKMHKYYIGLIDSKNMKYRTMGVGYWHGYNMTKGFLPFNQSYKSKNKRKKTVRLNVVCVDEDVVNNLHMIANKECMTFPKLRVKIYREYVSEYLLKLDQERKE